MDDSKYSGFERFTEFANHIAPASILIVDKTLNRIPFKRKSLLVIIPLMIIYAIVNFGVSLARG